MILAIRISGMIKVPKSVAETLYRLRLRRKYVAVLIEDNSLNQKILRGTRNYIAYGEINKEMLLKLIELRSKPISKDKKVDAKKVVSGLGKKKLSDLGVKPFFRLHPPRGGIESKKHFGVGNGVLGDNKDKINELLARML